MAKKDGYSDDDIKEWEAVHTEAWKRDKSQEEPPRVIRWFEKDDIIASVVEGNVESEYEVRVSGGNITPFKIPISKSIFHSKSDDDLLRMIDKHLQRR
jgi:hypothetical protein